MKQVSGAYHFTHLCSRWKPLSQLPELSQLSKSGLGVSLPMGQCSPSFPEKYSGCLELNALEIRCLLSASEIIRPEQGTWARAHKLGTQEDLQPQLRSETKPPQKNK